MTTITTRSGKGSPLTNNEMDSNLTNLNTDKIETAMIVAATSKTTPADADLFPLVDSAASNTLKKLTWANLKATIVGSFATLTGVETLTNKTLTSPVINGTGLNFTDSSVQTTAATGFGFKNRIINGAMMIDQRNAGALITSVANGAYMVDRFQCYHDIGTLNARQNLNSLTPPAGFTNYLGFANTSSSTSASTNYFNFHTSVEGLNWADLGWGTANAQPVTLSFWVRSSIAGTYSIAFNGQNSYGYPATYTINQANTWELKTITVAGPTSGTWVTDNTRSVSVIWDLGQGSNYRFTAGSWQSGTVQGATGSTNWNQTNGATFYITGVQLEKGSTATAYDYRPYGTELALCQRYYEVFSQYMGITASATAIRTQNTFKVEKRANPTVSLAAALYTDYPGSAAYTQSSANVVINSVSTNAAVTECGNFTGMTQGRPQFCYTNMLFSSEL